jgi:hypothetical protein
VRDQHGRGDGIHQSRELVGTGACLRLTLAQRILHPAALGEVHRAAHETRNAVDVDVRIPGDELEQLPVLATHGQLRGSLPFGTEDLGQRSSLFGADHPQFHAGLTDELLVREPGQFGERRVDIDECTVRLPGDRHGLRTQGEERLEPTFRRTQRILRQTTIMNVEGDRDPLCNFPIGAPKRSNPGEMPAIFTAHVPQPILDLRRRRRRERVGPRSRNVTAVVPMHDHQRALVLERLLLGEPGDLEPSVIDPLEATFRITGPDDLRQSIRECPIGASRPRERRRVGRVERRSIVWQHGGGRSE